MSNSEMKYSGWRPIRDHRPPMFSQQPPAEIPPTRFFDGLSFIGNAFVGCYVLETFDGLAMLDCTRPGQQSIERIEKGFHELGLDIRQLKAILITHGHPDHYGSADYFRTQYGACICMSETDEKYARAPDTPRPPHGVPMQFVADRYLRDGDVYKLGDTSVHIVATPGHTPGCLSFLFPVADEGRPHMAALWGGTGIPGGNDARQCYLASCEKFIKLCSKMDADVEISAHPFVDNSEERLAVCRSIVNGTANPYVIGKDALIRYHQNFRNMCLHAMEQSSNAI